MLCPRWRNARSIAEPWMLKSDIAVSRSTWSGLSRVSRSVWYPHTGTYLALLIAEISVSRLGFDIISPTVLVRSLYRMVVFVGVMISVGVVFFRGQLVWVVRLFVCDERRDNPFVSRNRDA